MKVCPTCTVRYDDEHHYCPVDGELLRSITPLPSDQLGTTLLGQFQLTAIAGRGMGGVVYKAWQQGMERDVAIKILHRQLVRDRSMVRRFQREARAVARLSHPNIVNVFTTGVTDYDAPFLVMEHIDGERLDHAIAAGPLSVERAVGIARQMVSALADTHAEGIIHRDLKPANVFLVQHRRTPDFVKILDFGIAKLVNNALTSTESRLTQDGAVCGTPHYIAPEQASGKSLDHRADLYSVGIMLYQMVAGRVPFEGSGMAVLIAHVSKDMPPPSRFVSDIPAGLEAIIMRCLAKDPSDRYQSAEAVADALDAFTRSQRELVNAATLIAGETAVSAFDSQQLCVASVAPSLLDVPRKRRWPVAMGCIAVLVSLGFGGAHVGGYTGGDTLSVDTQIGSAVASRQAHAPARDRSVQIARRAVVVSDGHYSLRVILPQRLLVDMHHEITMDLWDGGGEPLVTSEVVVTLSRERGGAKGLAAKPTERAGRYRFQRLLKHAGQYTLSVYPPGANDAIQVFFEVVRPSESNKE